MNKYHKSIIIGAISMSFVSNAQASVSVGAIDISASSTRVCHNDTCTSYGSITFTPNGTPVTVTDSGLLGYAWGNEMGWVNLAPSSSGVKIDPVTGELSGMAWSQTSGWINFRPANAGSLSGGVPIGVSITSLGEFYGWAWSGGSYGGWIKFDCSSQTTCVKTDWRKIGLRTTPDSGTSQVTRYAPSQFFSESVYAQKNPTNQDVIYTSRSGTTSSAILSESPLKSSSVTGVASSAGSPSFLTKTLRLTNQSREIIVLQTFLSKDKDVYPSGLITGYFGQATKKAVQAFQTKYSIVKPGEAGYGTVGPKTRAKINELLRKM